MQESSCGCDIFLLLLQKCHCDYACCSIEGQWDCLHSLALLISFTHFHLVAGVLYESSFPLELIFWVSGPLGSCGNHQLISEMEKSLPPAVSWPLSLITQFLSLCCDLFLNLSLFSLCFSLLFGLVIFSTQGERFQSIVQQENL